MDMMPGCHMGEHGLGVGTLSYDIGCGVHVDDGINAPGYEVEQRCVACAVHVPEGMGRMVFAKDNAQAPAGKIDDAA